MQPTDQIFFDGNYHRNVFFDGHYHKEAWLNSVCVWRKKKGTLIKNISMLSYVNGKYYAVVESTDYMYKKGIPILYEGTSLSRMHEKGKIFGDEPIRGEHFIMYADSDELTIIRTYNISERHIARIPISENGADMENITYDIENGVYRFSNYRATAGYRYFYGNGDNYYYGSGTGFYKNDNKLEGNIIPIISTKNKLISTYSITYNTNEFDGDLQFKTFDGNEEFHNYNINLKKVLENARELFIDERKMNEEQASSITLSNILREELGYSYIAMVSNSTGYVLLYIGLKNDLGSFGKYYKLKINFNTATLLGIKALNSYKGYIFYSYMIGNGKYRVQITGRRDRPSFPYGNGISYGLIGDDYENDVFIDRASISGIPSEYAAPFSSYTICSLAYNNDILIVRTFHTNEMKYGFMTIDTKNKTAKYSEIDMYAE